jgi:hypothetical protein
MSNGVVLIPINNGVQIVLSGSNNINSSLQNYDWTTGLTSGLNSQFITYPVVISSIPTTINSFFQNSIDNFTYLYSTSGITTSGFYINFSDYLKNTGYILNTEMFV